MSRLLICGGMMLDGNGGPGRAHALSVDGPDRRLGARPDGTSARVL
jgi:hypothetical protein